MSPPSGPKGRRLAPRLLLVAGLFVGAAALSVGLWRAFTAPGPPPVTGLRAPAASPLELASGGRLTVWWGAPSPAALARTEPAGPRSNIHPADYVGPESCKACHPGNYRAWSEHPHRWMNALAGPATVRGDFSAGAALSYRGGRATFRHQDGAYRMSLERGGRRRAYRVTQTIGSRFFQYYVGRQVEGPEPPEHPFYHKDHVLPFGYWLDQKEWLPVVHIGTERPDDERPDPFDPPDRGQYYAEYASSCNYCHTTFPLADLFGRRPHQVGEHAPRSLHWSVQPYLESARPKELQSIGPPKGRPGTHNPMTDWDAEHYAATFGVSCEACHLGARAHVASGGKERPEFFPRSPHLLVEGEGEGPPLDRGRSHDNVNWACGRCHTGTRPTFAAGMSTWNSVEYSDAMRGSCYSQLRCIDCHNPHKALGAKWAPSPDRDDAVCLKCHTTLRPAEARRAHTHHAPGSEGSRCLNCHMPRINEGIQDVVRTHMIYSPTRADMIEANHPNACNLCHTDRPIDWALRHLKEWYGRTYEEGALAKNYPARGGPVGLGWLRSDNPAVRLVAADALARTRGKEALPALLEALDDPYLVNRQFAALGAQRVTGARLADLGYRYYMTRAERRRPLDELRARWLRAPPLGGSR